MKATTGSRDRHALVHACLVEVADGPLFDDEEFGTLLGLSRDEVRAIAEQWPADEHPNTALAVNNSIVNLVGYPHGERRTAALLERLEVDSLDDLKMALARWEQDRASP